MKRIFIYMAFLAIIILPGYSFADGKECPPFKETVSLLQKAIKKGDARTLHQYVGIENIIKAKIEKYAHKAQDRKSFFMRSVGKITEIGAPALEKILVGVIDSEFSKSSESMRNMYLSQLKIRQIGEKNYYAFAAGTFLGSPAVIAAVKNDTKWLVVGAESPIIDREFKNLLAKAHIQ